jgi:hypothetical protein
MTTMCGQPSKLVMRVRFPSPAPVTRSNVISRDIGMTQTVGHGRPEDRALPLPLATRDALVWKLDGLNVKGRAADLWCCVRLRLVMPLAWW